MNSLILGLIFASEDFYTEVLGDAVGSSARPSPGSQIEVVWNMPVLRHWLNPMVPRPGR